MRRLLARALAVLIALTIVVGASLYLTLSSGRFERLFRHRLEAEGERLFHGTLRVDRLELTPLTLSAELTRVAAQLPQSDAEGGANGGPAADLTAEYVRIQLSPLAFLSRRAIAVRSAHIVGGRVQLDLDDPAVRSLFAGGGGAGPVPLERLVLDRCRLHLTSASRRLDLDLEALDADVRLGSGTFRAGGEFAVSEFRWRGWQLAPGRAVVTIAGTDGQIEVEQLRAELRTGTLSASGTIDTRAEQIELATAGSVELAAVTSILGRPGLAGGVAVVKGDLRGPLAAPRLTGKISIAELALFDAPVATEVAGDVTVAAAGLRLTAASAAVGAGSARFRGDFPFASKGPFSLDFTATDVAVGHLHRHLSLPLGSGQLTATGNLSVPYDAAPLRLETDVAFRDLEPLLRSEATDPVTNLMLGPFAGAGHLRYEAGIVDLRVPVVDGTWGQGNLAGTFEVDGPVDACIEIVDADLGALSMLEGPALPWLDSPGMYRLEGPVAANVRWTGTAVAPIFAGRGSIPSLELVGALAGQRIERVKVGAGADFAFEYRDRRLDWSATSNPDIGADAHGTLRLTTSGTGIQEAAVHVSGWDATELAQLFGVDRPLDGAIDIDARLHYDGRAWSAEYHTVGTGVFEGQPIDHLDAQVKTDRTGITVRDTVVESGGARVIVAGRVDHGGDLALTVAVDVLPLSALVRDAKVNLGGSLGLDLDIAGTTTDWSAVGDVTIADARLAETDFGLVRGTIHASPETVHLELAGDEGRELSADVVPVRPFPFRATASFAEFPLAPLASMLLPAEGLELSGSATGALVVIGAAAAEHPVTNASLEVTSSRVSVPGFRVASEGPWRLVMTDDGTIELSGLVLAHGDYRLQVGGVVGRGVEPWDLNVAGTADLQLARALLPTLFLSGPVRLDTRVRGIYPRLELDGTAHLESGYVRSPALPYPLRDATATARLEGRVIRVGDLTARFGGGQIRASASLDLDAPGGPHLAVAAEGEDVRFTLFDDLSVRADPVLSYEVDAGGRRLGGTLNVTRATYELRDGGLAHTEDEAAATAFARSEALRGFPETRLDLHVVAPGNLWLRADWIKLEGDAELRISGTTAEPTVLGSVRYLNQEKLELDGRRYRVTRGTLTFDNPTTIDPSIDFEATSSVQGYDLAVRVSGRLSDPRASVHSTPPLAEGDVLALLGGGQAKERSGVASLTGGQEILYQMLLPRAFGPIPLVSVSPEALHGHRDPIEVFPFTIQLPERIDVTVGFPRRDAATELIILNWRPVENYTLSAIRDLDRSWGLEALVERRFGRPDVAIAAAPRIAAVAIDGLPPELEVIARRKLKGRPGQAWSERDHRGDLDRLVVILRENGYPLARVDAAVAADTGASVVVQYTVVLGDLVTVSLEGVGSNRRLEKRLLETIQSFGLYAETEGELERVAHESYENDGFAQPLVACERTEPSIPESPAVRFRCDIEPGLQYTVSEVVLEGTASIPEPRLRAAITTRSTLFRPARLIATKVEADMRSIRAIYGAAGFLRARVRGEILQADGKRALRLLLSVEEGPQFRIGQVAVTGATAELPAELVAEIQATAGNPFEREAVRMIRDRLFQTYDRLGYLGANVQVLTTERTDESRLVDVEYDIEEGPVVRLSEVRVNGLHRARLKTVLQALGLEPGALLSYGRLARAQRRLYDLGVFRSVELSQVVVPGEPGRRNVDVTVEEASPYRVEVGGGFDSQDGMRGILALSDTNFTGRGRFLGLQLRASQSDGRAQILLREPRLLGREFPTLFTVFAERTSEVSFDADRLVFRTEVDRSLERRRRSRALLRYSLSATNLRRLQVSTIEAGEEEVLISSLGSTLLLDQRDDILEPRRGLFGSIDVVWASRTIGSDVDYTKLTLKAYRYAALGSRLVWASGAQIGVGFPRGAEQLPLVERYFAGGGSSLRGFAFNEAGPSDVATGRPTGGNAVLILNQELRLDLFGPIVTSLFVDVGNVYRDVDELGTDLRWSLGAGLRYRAAVVAGLDYARLLNPSVDEPVDQLRFSLGYAF